MLTGTIATPSFDSELTRGFAQLAITHIRLTIRNASHAAKTSAPRVVNGFKTGLASKCAMVVEHQINLTNLFF